MLSLREKGIERASSSAPQQSSSAAAQQKGSGGEITHQESAFGVRIRSWRLLELGNNTPVPAAAGWVMGSVVPEPCWLRCSVGQTWCAGLSRGHGSAGAAVLSALAQLLTPCCCCQEGHQWELLQGKMV